MRESSASSFTRSRASRSADAFAVPARRSAVVSLDSGCPDRDPKQRCRDGDEQGHGYPALDRRFPRHPARNWCRRHRAASATERRSRSADPHAHAGGRRGNERRDTGTAHPCLELSDRSRIGECEIEASNARRNTKRVSSSPPADSPAWGPRAASGSASSGALMPCAWRTWP